MGRGAMTKRVRAAEGVGFRLNETELHVMFVVASGDGPLKLSISVLSTYVGKTPGAVRNSLRSLRRKGILDATPRFLENGGQLENEYTLTGDGKSLLEAMLSQ